MIASELVTKFSFIGNINPIKDFNTQLGSAIPNTKRWAIGLAALGTGITALITKSLKNNNELAQFALRTGESVLEMTRLGIVATKTGGSMEALVGTVKGLPATLAKARLSGSEAFGKLGINIFDESGKIKKGTELIKELRKSRENLSKTERIEMFKEIGIDESLIGMLSLTDKEFKKLYEDSKAFGGLTDKMVKNIADFNNSLNLMSVSFNNLSDTIAASFAPEFSKYLDGITNAINANRGWLAPMGKIIAKTGMIAGAVASAVIALKALKWAMVSVKIAGRAMFLPLTVGILVIEDLWNAFSGGESHLKNLYNWILKIRESFNKWVWNGIDGMGDWFKTEFERIQKWWDELDFSFDFPSMPTWLGGGDDGEQVVETEIITKAPTSQGMGLQSVSNKSNSLNQTNNISIHTDRPMEVKKAIDDTLGKQIKQVQFMKNSGGQ